MTDKSDHEDHQLSRIYREGAWPEPKRQIDEAILAASRRAARARREASLVWRWAPRFALAATVVLTSTLVLRVYQEQPETVSPPAREVRPAPRVRQPVAPVPEAKPESAPAPKEQAPGTANPRSESMLLRYQSNPTRPDVAADAAKGFASEATRADRALQQSPRAPESAPPREPQPEPIRAPRRESPSTLSAPGVLAPVTNVISGIAAGRTADALERSPQTWLEDIRRLKAQGRNEEAARELAEFRKRHPEYPLPEDLR